MNFIGKSGTGIERSGTGIEKSGTGIERSGTGIERSGTGIEKSGTGSRMRNLLFSAMVASGVFGAAPVLADNSQLLITSAGDNLMVSLHGSTGVVTGAMPMKWSDGYHVVPLFSAIQINQSSNSQVLVLGSGAATEVQGSGSGGTEVQGSGSGGIEVQGSGSGGTEVQGSGSGGTEVQGSGSGGIEVQGSGSGGLEVQGSGSGGTEVQGSGSGGATETCNFGAVTLVLGSGSGASTEVQGSGSGGIEVQGSGSGGIEVQGSGSGGLEVQGSGSGGLEVQGSGSGGLEVQGSGSGGTEVQGSGSGAAGEFAGTCGIQPWGFAEVVTDRDGMHVMIHRVGSTGLEEYLVGFFSASSVGLSSQGGAFDLKDGNWAHDFIATP